MNAGRDDRSAKEGVPQDVEWTLRAQRQYDHTADDGLTATVVFAVAEAEGVEPLAVKQPPLFDVVDTAALEAAFFEHGHDSRAHDPNSSTEFMYRDHRVVVRSDGWVLVSDRAEE